MRLAGKIALITGGASGIGAATAARFVAEGARVALADLNLDRARAAADQLGQAAIAVRLDVTQPTDWDAAMAEASARLGRLTTVVNCAGISIPGDIESLSLEGFRQTLEVNLDGVFLGCKAAVAALKDGRGGAIVNVGSTLGVRAGALFPAYGASKAAVRQLTRVVAMHCAERGYDIRVNCILPGAIHTEMVEGYVAAGIAVGGTREAVLSGFASVHPMKRLGRPEEPANAIVFLASDEASFTTGADVPVDGGYLA